MANAGQGLAAARRQIGTVRKRLSPRVSVTGLTKARKEIQQAAKNARDLRKPLKVAAQMIHTEMDDCFRQERDPAGIPWKALADSTLRQRIGKAIGGKASRYKKGKTDQGVEFRVEKTAAQRALETRKRRFDSAGRYKAKYADKAYKAAFGGGVKILTDSPRLRKVTSKATRNGVTFGTGVHYGIYHQVGTKNMPRRMFAPVVLVGNQWRTIKMGPAGLLWDRIANMFGRFVLNANGEPKWP